MERIMSRWVRHVLNLEQLQVPHDVGERGVQLVGDAGCHLSDGGQLLRLQELSLGLPQLLDRPLLPLEELGVLDGQSRMAGQGLRRAQALGPEGRRGLLVVDVDGAQHAR
jgi:hypothetical protein